MTSSTRTLLTGGAFAGPLFAVVSWTQVALTPGFDISWHYLSQLGLGPHGWIQVANLVVTGSLFLGAAVGLRRALPDARRNRWAARLLGGFGVSLVVAGVFPTDPAHGYPVGSAQPEAMSWHAIIHATGPGVGIVLAALACLFLARQFAVERRTAFAAVSVVAAVLMFLPDGFPGTGAEGYTLALALTGTAGFCWCSVVLADRLLRVHEVIPVAPRSPEPVPIP